MALDGSITTYFDYLALGLSPGGYVTSILLGNIGDAYARAHPNLFLTKMASWGMDENIVANAVHVIREYLPYPPAMNSLEAIRMWIAKEGMSGFTDQEKAAFILEYAHTPLGISIADNYHDNKAFDWLRIS